MGVNLNIETLLLDGFRSADRHRIAEALQGELARLIATHGTPASFEITGPLQFHATPLMKPEAVGEHVAQSIYRGWTVPHGGTRR
jgi:hypothetical protein